MTIEILNIDCMDYMQSQPDNAFDLAIVDPPYGIGMAAGHERIDYKIFAGGDAAIPDPVYFSELYRVSKNQIIWGANYFALSWCRGFIVWDKKQPENFSMAMCEYAWSSFDVNAKIYRQFVVGADNERIHPTQKPVKLYRWILENYSNPGERILDTHLGSGSSAIAAHYFGVDFVGCELSEHYYNASKERFDRETAQISLI